MLTRPEGGAKPRAVRITIASGEPDKPPEGELPRRKIVWEGGDGQEKDALPGSLCKDLVPGFDVGTWRRFDEVRTALQSGSPEPGALASIRVTARIGRDEPGPSIRIHHVAAARAMLSAAIELCSVLRRSTKELWICVV